MFSVMVEILTWSASMMFHLRAGQADSRVISSQVEHHARPASYEMIGSARIPSIWHIAVTKSSSIFISAIGCI